MTPFVGQAHLLKHYLEAHPEFFRHGPPTGFDASWGCFNQLVFVWQVSRADYRNECFRLVRRLPVKPSGP